MIGWATAQPGLRMFLAIIATLWFGCSNAAQQIVGELPVFRRERISGLSLPAYLCSKFAFLLTITSLQALALVATLTFSAALFHPLPIDRDKFVEHLRTSRDVAASVAPATGEPDFGETMLYRLAKYGGMELNILDSGTRPAREVTATAAPAIPGRTDPGRPVWSVVSMSLTLRAAALLLAALTGVAFGLAASALARTTTQAAMGVPLILIPQILFGGYVLTHPEMNAGVRFFSALVPSCHAQQISDTGLLLGQRVPACTNKTRIPVFLSSERNLAPAGSAAASAAAGSEGLGEEVVFWHHGEPPHEQSYVKTAPHNAAWQNLIVDAALTGQRLLSTRENTEPDYVNTRADVTLARYSLYTALAPALRSTAVLILWSGTCCGLIALRLRSRPTRG